MPRFEYFCFKTGCDKSFFTKRVTYLASKANAKTPAASGAAAEVPEWVLVHFPYKSVVACKKRSFRLDHCQSSSKQSSKRW